MVELRLHVKLEKHEKIWYCYLWTVPFDCSNRDFMETPFRLGSPGFYALDLAFHSSQAPLFVTFVLNIPDGIWIRYNVKVKGIIVR